MNRFAGSSVIARWVPPGFNNGLDGDSTEARSISPMRCRTSMSNIGGSSRPAPDRLLAQRRAVAQRVRDRKLVDELAAAAKQDPVAYRRALPTSRRAPRRCSAAAAKAGWGQRCRRASAAASRCSSCSAPTAVVAEVEVGARRGPRCDGWSARSTAAGGQPRHRAGAGAGRGPVRCHGGVAWRDHPEERPRRAENDSTSRCAWRRRRRSRSTSSRAASHPAAGRVRHLGRPAAVTNAICRDRHPPAQAAGRPCRALRRA